MATMEVTRSSGEKVKLELISVNRQSMAVTISIPSYNAMFTFVPGPKLAVLSAAGRNVIDPTQDSTTHISETVYRGMARWATAILNDPRPRKI